MQPETTSRPIFIELAPTRVSKWSLKETNQDGTVVLPVLDSTSFLDVFSLQAAPTAPAISHMPAHRSLELWHYFAGGLSAQTGRPLPVSSAG